MLFACLFSKPSFLIAIWYARNSKPDCYWQFDMWMFHQPSLLVGHFDIEAICHCKDWSRGWFGIGKQCVRSIWSSFCKFPANLFCLCLFYNWDQGQEKKKIVVKQGKATSVDKEILGIAKSWATTFQDLIKVGIDGDIAWHNLLCQRNRILKKETPPFCHGLKQE